MNEGHHAFRSLLLGWTDPESGDELTIDVRGGSDFARGLADLGFEVLANRGASEPAPLHGADVEVVAQQRAHGKPHSDGARPGELLSRSALMEQLRNVRAERMRSGEGSRDAPIGT